MSIFFSAVAVGNLYFKHGKESIGNHAQLYTLNIVPGQGLKEKHFFSEIDHHLILKCIRNPNLINSLPFVACILSLLISYINISF